MAKYRILSFDGGGMRGALSAHLLRRLVWHRPALMSDVDLFAGTSTGAIIALCLAKRISPDTIMELYKQRCKDIFSKPRWAISLPWDSKYKNAALKQVLTETFGDTRLGSLSRKVIICTFDLDAIDGNGQRLFKPKFFHNLVSGSDCDRSLVDLAMMSCAAPTYFPSYMGFIDGGVIANNPSMCAVAQALNPGTVQNVSLDDISLLSIGTGKNGTYIEGQALDWGLLDWAKKIVSVMMTGSVDTVDYQCRYLLKERYNRINPYLSEDYDMDEYKEIPALIDIADKYDISSHYTWLDNHY